MDTPETYGRHRCALLLGCLLATPALAQTLPALAPDAPELEPVTVRSTREEWESPPGYLARRSATATKTDTRIADTPASISVVTRAQMDDQAAASVAQALRYTPGVVAEVRSSPRYDTVFMRGFGGFGQTSNYVGYLDGLALPRGLSYLIPGIDPWTLERIDVIRGPNSVLYGQVNPGGLVNQISRRAAPGVSREVQIGFGTHGLRQAGIDLGGDFGAQGEWSWRLVGLARESRGDSGLKQERQLLAPSLTWRPQAGTSLTLQAFVQRDPETGDYNGLPAQGTLLPHPLGRIPLDLFTGEPSFERFSRDQRSIGWLLTHDFSESLTLQHKLRYLSADSQYRNVSGALLNPANSVLMRQASAADETLHGLATDTQLRWRFGSDALRHTLMAGLSWQRASASRLLGAGAPGMPLDFLNPVYGITVPTPAFTTDSHRRQTQTGLYLQDQVEAGPWLLQLGARHDRVRTDDEVTTLATGAVAPIAQRDGKTSFNVSAMYRMPSGWSPYVSYSTSFEPTTAVNLYGDPFQPSTARQAEAGVKFQPQGRPWLVSAALFELTRRNVLTKDPTPGAPPARQIQTGEVRVRGLELEARADLSRSLNAIAALTLLDPQVTRSNVAGEQGHLPVAVPERTAALWLNQRLLGGTLGLSAGVRHVAASWADVANTLRVPGYTLVDLGLRYDLGHLQPAWQGVELSVNASNVADKRYLASCAPAGTGTGCFAGPQRHVTAHLRYQW